MMKAKEPNDSTIDDLTEPLLVEILRKLPIKTLGRCTSVCKSWRNLIKSPAFISSHLSFNTWSRKEYSPLLIIKSYKGWWRCLLLSNQQVEEYMRLPCYLFDCNFVVGACNGLVCLSPVRLGVYLLNPLIEKWCYIPMPVSSSRLFPFCMGFGYDSVTRDYKVIRIVENESKNCIEVIVYSLKSESWKTISFPPEVLDFYSLVTRTSMSFVNGSLHCIAAAKAKDSDKFHSFILSFNLDSEEVSEMALPESVQSPMPQLLWSIHTFKDSSIAVVKYGDTFHEVWVMREYGVVASWTQLSTIPEELKVLHVEAFTKNGGFIVNSGKGDLIWDPESKEYMPLLKEHYDGNTIGIFPFVESLVLLDEDNNEDYSCHIKSLVPENEGVTDDEDNGSLDYENDNEEYETDDHYATASENDFAPDDEDYAIDYYDSL